MTESLQSHLLNLYALALSDSQFDEKELLLLYQIAEEKGVKKIDFDQLLLNPASVKVEIPNSIEERVEYLYDYAKMIWADGKVDASEINTLEKFCVKLEFEQNNAPAITEFLIAAVKDNVPTSDILKFLHQQSN